MYQYKMEVPTRAHQCSRLSFSLPALTIYSPFRTQSFKPRSLTYFIMFYQPTASSALAAITLLVQVSASAAGHARAHIHAGHNHRARAVAGSVEVPMTELSMLQSEQITFSGWINDWFNASGSANHEAAVALLQQEYQAYQGWMSAWLDSAMSAGVPAPTALPVTAASVPLPVATNSAVSADTPAPTLRPVTFASVALPVATTLTSILVPVKPSATAGSVTSTPPFIAASSVAAPELDHIAHSSASGPQHSAASPYHSPTSPSQVPVEPSPATSAATHPSTLVIASSAPVASTAPSGSGSSGGSFNAQSNSNVAVYYGQSPATSQVTLAQMCQDSSVDIIVLAFLTTFFGPGGYPQVNFGSACGSTVSEAMTAKGASGLLSCPTMAQDITTCQKSGKKVLLSLGGSLATSAFSSDSQADQFATMLWNLFGSGTGEDAGLRPFGDVKVDGFDLGKCSTFTIQFHLLISRRQRRSQHRFLLLLRLLPPHHNVRRQKPHLLHLRCPTMSTSRRFHPPRCNANHGLRLRSILQQRRLQCRRIRLRR